MNLSIQLLVGALGVLVASMFVFIVTGILSRIQRVPPVVVRVSTIVAVVFLAAGLLFLVFSVLRFFGIYNLESTFPFLAASS